MFLYVGITHKMSQNMFSVAESTWTGYVCVSVKVSIAVWLLPELSVERMWQLGFDFLLPWGFKVWALQEVPFKLTSVFGAHPALWLWRSKNLLCCRQQLYYQFSSKFVNTGNTYVLFFHHFQYQPQEQIFRLPQIQTRIMAEIQPLVLKYRANKCSLVRLLQLLSSCLLACCCHGRFDVFVGPWPSNLQNTSTQMKAGAPRFLQKGCSSRQ